MVKKVVLSDQSDDDEQAPQIISKTEAAKNYYSQKLSIKPHTLKKAPKLQLFSQKLADEDI